MYIAGVRVLSFINGLMHCVSCCSANRHKHKLCKYVDATDYCLTYELMTQTLGGRVFAKRLRLISWRLIWLDSAYICVMVYKGFMRILMLFVNYDVCWIWIYWILAKDRNFGHGICMHFSRPKKLHSEKYVVNKTNRTLAPSASF